MSATEPSSSVEVGRGSDLRGTAAWAFLFMVFAAAPLLVAYENAMHFSGSAIDGPFQLYNALRRIQAGFRPGVDFQFFHGLGTAYLHYLPYRLFGGGLAGSQLARELIAAAAQPLVLLLAFRLFLGEWRKALALAALGMGLTFMLKLSAILFAVNGMVGLRASLPTLAPALFFTMRTSRARAATVGAALGLSLFLSTEQGLAVCLAFILVAIIGTWRSSNRGAALREFITTFALALIVFLVALISVGGLAGALGALQYGLRFVPMDQYWYFGSPPNTFAPSWSALARMLATVPLILGALVIAVVFAVLHLRRFWGQPGDETGRRNLALAFLALYGLVSCTSLLGVFTPAYVQPCWRAILIIGLIDLVDGLAQRDRQRATLLGLPRALAATTLVGCALALATVPLVPVALASSLPHVVSQHVAHRVPFSADSMWMATLRDGQAAIEKQRATNEDPVVLWSTYAGWLEARNGMFNPSFDYVIHALGAENRETYIATFRKYKPSLVQTVRPAYSQYEAWIENHHWALYDELLDGYTVSSTTPWSFFWERRASPAPPPVFIASMEVPAGMSSTPLPPIPDSLASPITLLEIDVDYAVHNPLKGLPIVGATPRYLIGIRDAVSRIPISLDPFVTHTRFSMLVERGRTASLEFQTFSLLPGASWAPRSIRVMVRRVNGPNTVWLDDLIARLKSNQPAD